MIIDGEVYEVTEEGSKLIENKPMTPKQVAKWILGLSDEEMEGIVDG